MSSCPSPHLLSVLYVSCLVIGRATFLFPSMSIISTFLGMCSSSLLVSCPYTSQVVYPLSCWKSVPRSQVKKTSVTSCTNLGFPEYRHYDYVTLTYIICITHEICVLFNQTACTVTTVFPLNLYVTCSNGNDFF